MSNARNLANFLGTGTTVPSSKLSLVAADMPAGNILQVVNTVHSANVAINGSTSTEYTGITTAITPKVTGSKIYIMANVSCGNLNNGAEWYESILYRDSTSNQISTRADFYFNSRYEMIGPKLLFAIFDPTTTTAGTARTYKVYLNGDSGNGALQINWNNNNSQSSMTLMEIAA